MARSNVRAYPSQGFHDVALEAYRQLNALMDEVNQMAYMALSSAGLAIGVGSKKEILIANTVVFVNAGVFKSKATAEVAFTATVHDIPAHATLVQEAVYLLTLNAAGTPAITMGEISSGAASAAIPDAPADSTPIGHVRIAVAAGATPFDATSDDLDAAHITDTYTNVAFLLPGASAKTIVAGN